jgi:hypothetical protein
MMLRSNINRSHSGRPRSWITRKVSLIAAAIILLLGQTIAAAHFHPTSSQRQLSSTRGAGIADSSCAICAAHFHSPATAAVIPAFATPTIGEDIVLRAVHAGPRSTFVGHLFGRAPPASV